MFRQLRVPVLGVIENMSHFVCGHCGQRTDIFGHGGGQAMAEQMSIPFLGEIPIDTTVRLGSDEGRPIVIGAPESAAALAFRNVARQAAAQISIQTARTLPLVNSPKP
jgi:ATP-binding protein involved in chromosome partitioning